MIKTILKFTLRGIASLIGIPLLLASPFLAVYGIVYLLSEVFRLPGLVIFAILFALLIAMSAFMEWVNSEEV